MPKHVFPPPYLAPLAFFPNLSPHFPSPPPSRAKNQRSPTMEWENSYEISGTVDFIRSRNYTKVVLQVSLSFSLPYLTDTALNLTFFSLSESVPRRAAQGLGERVQGSEARAWQERKSIRDGRHGVQFVLYRRGWRVICRRGVCRALWPCLHEPVRIPSSNFILSASFV